MYMPANGEANTRYTVFWIMPFSGVCTYVSHGVWCGGGAVRSYYKYTCCCFCCFCFVEVVVFAVAVFFFFFERLFVCVFHCVRPSVLLIFLAFVPGT